MISPTDIHNAKILIVDDQQADISLLDRLLLGAGYTCVSSTMDPREVCNLYRRNRYDLILLDLKMPGMDGFQVLEALKEIVMEGYLPVLVITAEPGKKLRALQNGAKDFISKPFDLAEVLARVRNILEVCLRLNRSLVAQSRNLALTNVGMLNVLGSAIAKRDSDTNVHNYRVVLYSVWIGERLGLSPAAMQGLLKGAFLHDLGKIAISDAVLHKPGKLTAEEFDIMKTHVKHGEDIIRSHDWLQDSLEVVSGHHEKFDGSGYPVGLKGKKIPLNARIFAVVDVFDALTSVRPYKKAFSFAAATEILRESLGSHFDPEVTQVFLSNAEVLHAEICTDDEAFLYGSLATCIGKYF